MGDKCIAEFNANGSQIKLISHDNGESGFTVFTRVLANWDLDDVDCYNRKDSAVARFIFLTNRLLLEVQC